MKKDEKVDLMRQSINHRIKVFNHIIEESDKEVTSGIYKIKEDSTPEGLVRQKKDLDNLFNHYNLEQNESIKQQYLSLRERLESYRDIVKSHKTSNRN
jgi:hypothetical protein